MCTDLANLSCDMKPRTWWAAGLFVVYVSAQVAVSSLMLAGPRPSRFGWQMYAGIRTLDAYTVVLDDASTKPVDLGAFFGNPRADVSIDPAMMAPYICRRHADARSVLVREVMTGHTQEFTCAGR